MLCRLCLFDILNSKAIPLYDSEKDPHPTEYVLLIDKYLHLKVPCDDEVSTYLCCKCSQSLKDFDEFHSKVEEVQNSLISQIISKSEEKYNHINDRVEKASVGEDVLQESEIKLEEYSFDNVGEEKEFLDESSDDNVTLQELMEKSSFEAKKKNTWNLKRIKKGNIIQKRVVKENEQLITTFMKLKCALCSQICPSFAKLRAHFLEVHNETYAYVKCCNNKYQNPAKLAAHIKWHQNPEAFKCKLCNVQLKSKANLDIHMYERHNDAVELENNEENGNLACPHCPRKFRFPAFLRKHINLHEQGVDFTCKPCGKIFFKLKALKSHISSYHEDLHPFVCEICGKKFKTKNIFQRHVLDHQGLIDEKPLKCEDCGQWLKNDRSYRAHTLTHKKQEVACNDCGKMMACKEALRRHIRYWHKEKPLVKCQYCEKSFKDKNNYKEHLAVHSRAALYTCEHCRKEFRSKSNMYAHVKKKHVEEWRNAKLVKSHDPHLKMNLCPTSSES